MNIKTKKTDNLIVIFLCSFLGSCFTVSPEKAFACDMTFEHCLNAEENKDTNDCEKLQCWIDWLQDFDNSSHQNQRFYAVQRLNILEKSCKN